MADAHARSLEHQLAIQLLLLIDEIPKFRNILQGLCVLLPSPELGFLDSDLPRLQITPFKLNLDPGYFSFAALRNLTCSCLGNNIWK